MENSRNYSYLLNFGPQHPSAHGVLRLILEMDGELVLRADPHIGLLHRGTEKLLEHKTYLQGLPYWDRLDYVSMMTQEHTYVLAIEKIKNINVPRRAQQIRVLYSEITRILNHLMAITTHALDVGALTPFLWGFEEREKLMELYENVSGARMHAAYFRAGGVAEDLPPMLLEKIATINYQLKARVNEIRELLDNNRIWKKRLVNINVIPYKMALQFGLTGVLARASGIQRDLRITEPYETYGELAHLIRPPISDAGDSYSRYLIRIHEMLNSIDLIDATLNSLTAGPVKHDLRDVGTNRNVAKTDMQGLITHFRQYSEDFRLTPGSTYVGVETPKGELGAFLISDGSSKPYRCKIRPTGISHLQALNYMVRGLYIPDVVAAIGTQDIVFGEVDR